jgi:hypothetical protein
MRYPAPICEKDGERGVRAGKTKGHAHATQGRAAEKEKWINALRKDK